MEDNHGLREVRFRFQHEGCWIQESTERHPGLMLVASSIYLRDHEVHMNLGVHAPEPETVEQLAHEWEADQRVHQVRRLRTTPQGAVFHVSYTWEGSIYRDILEHTPVSIGAIRVTQGIEHYQLMGEYPDLRDLLNHLSEKGTLELVSIRSPSEVTAAGDAEDQLWDQLTEKQLQAVVAAHDAGYYEWPRKVSASELASELGLSSSAFLDHLRHGEAKLLAGLLSNLTEREPGRLRAVLQRLRGPSK